MANCAAARSLSSSEWDDLVRLHHPHRTGRTSDSTGYPIDADSDLWVRRAEVDALLADGFLMPVQE